MSRCVLLTQMHSKGRQATRVQQVVYAREYSHWLIRCFGEVYEDLLKWNDDFTPHDFVMRIHCD